MYADTTRVAAVLKAKQARKATQKKKRDAAAAAKSVRSTVRAPQGTLGARGTTGGALVGPGRTRGRQAGTVTSQGGTVPKKPASKRKQSKARDGGPKKGRTAYSFFSKAEYKRLKTTHAGTSFAEKSRLVADRWKGLDGVAKERYAQLSDADKGKCAQEKRVYEKKRQREGDGGGAAPVDVQHDSSSKKKKAQRRPSTSVRGGLKKQSNTRSDAESDEESDEESDGNWVQTRGRANGEGPVHSMRQHARAQREDRVDYAAMFENPGSDDDY